MRHAGQGAARRGPADAARAAHLRRHRDGGRCWSTWSRPSGLKLGRATRRTFVDPELHAPWADLVARRDALYAASSQRASIARQATSGHPSPGPWPKCFAAPSKCSGAGGQRLDWRPSCSGAGGSARIRVRRARAPAEVLGFASVAQVALAEAFGLASVVHLALAEAVRIGVRRVSAGRWRKRSSDWLSVRARALAEALDWRPSGSGAGGSVRSWRPSCRALAEASRIGVRRARRWRRYLVAQRSCSGAGGSVWIGARRAPALAEVFGLRAYRCSALAEVTDWRPSCSGAGGRFGLASVVLRRWRVARSDWRPSCPALAEVFDESSCSGAGRRARPSCRRARPSCRRARPSCRRVRIRIQVVLDAHAQAAGAQRSAQASRGPLCTFARVHLPCTRRPDRLPVGARCPRR